jgi:hypothetical protein
MEDVGGECGYVWGRGERHERLLDGKLKEIGHLKDQAPL